VVLQDERADAGGAEERGAGHVVTPSRDSRLSPDDSRPPI
jgi:hypothetical protein